MKVHDLRDREGRVFAFEVNNLLLGRQGACRVVRTIPGAFIIRRPQRFAPFPQDEFCEFELDGIRFVMEEPWGDNSRYWIGPTPPRWVQQTAIVRAAFVKAGVWGWFSGGSADRTFRRDDIPAPVDHASERPENPRRPLTSDELVVLEYIRELYGDLNTSDQVIFSDNDEAVNPPESKDNGDDAMVGAPRKPMPTLRDSSVALPEPDGDDLGD